MGNGAPDDWMNDSLVQVAFVTATVPLAVFYPVTRRENVFYQPLSPTGYALGLLALIVPILMRRRERVRFGVVACWRARWR